MSKFDMVIKELGTSLVDMSASVVGGSSESSTLLVYPLYA